MWRHRGFQGSVWRVWIQVTKTGLRLKDEGCSSGRSVLPVALCCITEKLDLSNSAWKPRCLVSGSVRVVPCPAWPHHRDTSFRVPGADAATTTAVLCWVFLVVRSWGWLPWRSQCSRIRLVDQAGQLKNSLKYPRAMYLFCIVFERINIPKPWCQKRELCDFSKTGHAASLKKKN